MVPPGSEEPAAWAGEGRVVRADPAAITNWRLPEHQKAALINTGIPLIGEPRQPARSVVAEPLHTDAKA